MTAGLVCASLKVFISHDTPLYLAIHRKLIEYHCPVWNREPIPFLIKLGNTQIKSLSLLLFENWNWHYLYGVNLYHYCIHAEVSEESIVWQVREDVREIIKTLCKYKDVEIINGAVCEDHVYLSVAIPVKYSISNFMGYLKGKSTLMIYDRQPHLQSKWGKAFWVKGYYVSTIGNITEEAIEEYIREQGKFKEYRFIANQ